MSAFRAPPEAAPCGRTALAKAAGPWCAFSTFPTPASVWKCLSPWRLSAAISFSSDDMKMSGQATVRFCRRQGTKYLVGAEFSGGGRVQLHSPA
jgi:hypothetical protein